MFNYLVLVPADFNVWQDDKKTRGVKIDWKITTDDARKALKYERTCLNK